jgi:hypothetical protein
VHSRKRFAAEGALAACARQADHSSPQTWTTWPGDTSRYCRTGGQTLAAQYLCTGVRTYRRVHHMQASVGHYGVFSGNRWNNEIYPLLRDFVYSIRNPSSPGPDVKCEPYCATAH